MRTLAIAFGAFGLLAACNPSAETNNPPVATDQAVAEREATAPNVGASSFTEAQARQHLTDKGYTDVTGLAQGPDGAWRGMAKKDGKAGTVSVDYQGNVTMTEGTTP